MKNLNIFIIIFLFFSLSNINAGELDKRNKITKNLRCLICQGQSVYDSDSEFANSLKIVVDEKIKEGLSEKQIYDYFKEKYGEISLNKKKEEFIEAHHKIPVHTLPENETIEFKIEDFAVLCSNCHRMAHKLSLIHISEPTRRS